LGDECTAVNDRVWFRGDGKVPVLIVLLVCSAVGSAPAAGETTVGWELDLSSPKIVDCFAGKLFHDKTARKRVQERYSVEVVDGVLRMTGDYGTDAVNMGDYVQIFINFPGGIDLTKFPVVEVEWRTNAPSPEGCLLLSVVSQTMNGEDASSYFYPDAGKTGEWSTLINQYVPDAGFPTRGTPVKITRIAVRAYADGGATGEYALEIRSFKVRGFTDEEAAEREPSLSVYRDFNRAGVPEPWASKVFMFGLRGYCRGPEGYESWYDNLVRSHCNMSADQISQGGDWRGWEKLPHVDEYIEARRKELAVARPRGLYIQPVLPFAGEMNNRGPDGLAWAESYARKLADAFKDEPYLASWYLADEISSDRLWGFVAAKSALDRADPSKLSTMSHFGVSRILRFEPYMSVIMTSSYPITVAKRDPWSIGARCREMDERSDRPHWIFLPAFGHSDWWQPSSSKPLQYLYPTRAELRLMTHLAIANGIKGITYYLYSTPNLWPGIFDVIGNPLPLDDPLIQDISAVGEKLAEIGPMLLTTKLLPTGVAQASGDAEDERGLTVGVRQAPDGGAFLIVLNESVEKEQGGRVSLSGQLAGRGRFIYDLYALRKTNPARPFGFKVTDLVPGDGRIYFVGTPQQFDDMRSAMLRNRALEILRVANLDRLVAERWNVDVSAIDARFEKARRAASHGETDESEKARDMVQALLDGNTNFARCRRVMLETRELLGRAYYTAHRGFDVAWPGCDGLLNPALNLFKRFSPLAERYYRGEKEGLRKLFEALGTEGKDLLVQAREMRTKENSGDTRINCFSGGGRDPSISFRHDRSGS
jgi:hypothetical protein